MIYLAEQHGDQVKKVFVDGVEISHCIMADTDEGIVLYLASDDAGQPKTVTEIIDGKPVIKCEELELRGTVTVELWENAESNGT